MSSRQYLRPYAALAAIEHMFDVNHLDIYLIFKFPMLQTIKPPNAIWICEVEEVVKAVTASAWQDEFTMLLTVAGIATRPDKVTIEYDGPSPLLTTTWFKQWEPWGAIISDEIQPVISTRTITGPANVAGFDVANVKIIFLNTTIAGIIIRGFVGGINGQELEIVKTDDTGAQFAALFHNAGTGNQDIFLHAGINEILSGEYGGWHLAGDGSNWYDVSHSKHV